MIAFNCQGIINNAMQCLEIKYELKTCKWLNFVKNISNFFITIKGEIQMINKNYSSQKIHDFLKGRDYLLAVENCWVNGEGREIAIISMDARYQLNCMKWLIMCLEDLEGESEEVKDEMKPLIITKMDDFKDIFPIVVKKEGEQLRISFKEKYKEMKRSFKERLYKL